MPTPDSPLHTLLLLEKEIRHARTPEAFGFTAANRTRSLLPCRQTALISLNNKGRARVEAVSDAASLDRNAPFIRWLERAAHAIARGERGRRVHTATPGELTERDRPDWSEWSALHPLWTPLITPDGDLIGALWLARDVPWSQGETVLAERLADTYAHAQAALGRRRNSHWGGGTLRRLMPWFALAVLVAALFIPVRQSVLAPAEAAPRNPTIAAAPLDGVIDRFFVTPNQTVRAGEPLYKLRDDDFRNRYNVAREEHAVALAELRKSAQGAFTDPESNANRALLKARAGLRREEMEYALELLERSTVSAPRGGLTVFNDPNDWIGRPVVTGTPVMRLVDPEAVEVDIRLPVKEAIHLEPGADVLLFLDVAPLEPLAAHLVRLDHEAEVQPGNQLAYRAIARFGEEVVPPRIGLKGTAKLFGDPVPLYLYLFRRPIAAFRQELGW